jgi:Bacterial regulatory proteins, luxR family
VSTPARSGVSGLGNHEIAERLVVSPATAKTHVSRAMVKLNAHDRAKLVVFAYEPGLVRPRTDTATPSRVDGSPHRPTEMDSGFRKKQNYRACFARGER